MEICRECKFSLVAVCDIATTAYYKVVGVGQLTSDIGALKWEAESGWDDGFEGDALEEVVSELNKRSEAITAALRKISALEIINLLASIDKPFVHRRQLIAIDFDTEYETVEGDFLPKGSFIPQHIAIKVFFETKTLN